jgi:hypothetical protein
MPRSPGRYLFALLAAFALAGAEPEPAPTPPEQLPPAPVPVSTAEPEPSPPSEPPDKPSSDEKKDDKKDEEDAFRPRLRHGLNWIISHGRNHLDVIEWADRPDLFTLADLTAWPDDQKDYQLDGGLGFNVRWLAGPEGNGTGPRPPNLPPHVFDLYWHATWRQRWADGVTSELTILPGLYTDFGTTPTDSFRCPAVALFAFRLDPGLHLIAGAWYLQRDRVKVLPVAGLLYEPNDRWQFRLVFPEPKVSYQLASSADVWVYVRGEYGGGRWTVNDDFHHGDRLEYSDVRIAAGFEVGSMSRALCPNAKPGMVFAECGYVFDRSLSFTNGRPTTALPAGWMLSLGCTW